MNTPLCTGHEPASAFSRRQFLNKFGMGLGGMALADLMNPATASADTGILGAPHFAPKAKRIIYLFQSGGPSQLDTFDYKPLLKEKHGTQLPDEVRQGQRLTGMSGNQSSIPLVGSPYEFKQHGESGAWVSNQLPYTAKIADDLCFVKAMHTEAINHGPGVTFLQTTTYPGKQALTITLNHPNGIVQFMSHAGSNLAQRTHFFSLQ